MQNGQVDGHVDGQSSTKHSSNRSWWNPVRFYSGGSMVVEPGGLSENQEAPALMNHAGG